MKNRNLMVVLSLLIYFGTVVALGILFLNAGVNLYLCGLTFILYTVVWFLLISLVKGGLSLIWSFVISVITVLLYVFREQLMELLNSLLG